MEEIIAVHRLFIRSGDKAGSVQGYIDPCDGREARRRRYMIYDAYREEK
jgi:hypothetical protein